MHEDGLAFSWSRECDLEASLGNSAWHVRGSALAFEGQLFSGTHKVCVLCGEDQVSCLAVKCGDVVWGASHGASAGQSALHWA